MLILREGSVLEDGGGVELGIRYFWTLFAFHGDGHENTKMTSNTNPLAPNRSLCAPRGCIDAQGECRRLERSMSYRSLPF